MIVHFQQKGSATVKQILILEYTITLKESVCGVFFEFNSMKIQSLYVEEHKSIWYS